MGELLPPSPSWQSMTTRKLLSKMGLVSSTSTSNNTWKLRASPGMMSRERPRRHLLKTSTRTANASADPRRVARARSPRGKKRPRRMTSLTSPRRERRRRRRRKRRLKKEKDLVMNAQRSQRARDLVMNAQRSQRARDPRARKEARKEARANALLLNLALTLMVRDPRDLRSQRARDLVM